MWFLDFYLCKRYTHIITYIRIYFIFDLQFYGNYFFYYCCCWFKILVLLLLTSIYISTSKNRLLLLNCILVILYIENTSKKKFNITYLHWGEKWHFLNLLFICGKLSYRLSCYYRNNIKVADKLNEHVIRMNFDYCFFLWSIKYLCNIYISHYLRA